MAIGSDVLNTREAARLLGAHVETVRRLARRGLIPSFKVGKDWRYHKDALQRWFQEQRFTHGNEFLPVVGDKLEDSSALPGQGADEHSLEASLDAVRRYTATDDPRPGDSRSADQDRSLVAKILGSSVSADNLGSVLRAVAFCLQKWIGCDAVGIRLREGLDFPYCETRGFSEEFVLAEQHLCARDSMDELLRDSDGNPVLECMCGNVICGRFDTSMPFFTERGSFWSNSTTELLASTTEEDRQARTRDRCNGEGYESVALFPLRSEIEILGLLQINDRRKDLFRDEIITLLEQVAESIAFVVLQNEALRSQQDGTPMGGRLDAQCGLVVAGRSYLHPESSPTSDPEPVILEVALDRKTHRVLTVVCEGLPQLGKQMLTRFLLGKTLPGALRDATEGMINGYYSDLRQPIVAALEDLLQHYRELPNQASTMRVEAPRSVLIIDDDEMVCRAMIPVIESLGCTARIATGGTEGLELVARQVPDLILLDLRMPDMNGPEFLKELRLTHPDLPVVIITGYPDSELMKQATRYAPLMLLAKPAEKVQLERTVRMVLGDSIKVQRAV